MNSGTPQNKLLGIKQPLASIGITLPHRHRIHTLLRRIAVSRSFSKVERLIFLSDNHTRAIIFADLIVQV